MRTETLTWHELPQDGPPDADLVVLAEVRDLDDADTTEVWPAIWLDGAWRDSSSAWPIEAGRVVAWADLPLGVST